MSALDQIEKLEGAAHDILNQLTVLRKELEDRGTSDSSAREGDKVDPEIIKIMRKRQEKRRKGH